MNKRNCLAAAGFLALASCQTAQVADVLTNAQMCNYLAMYANGLVSGGCTQLGDPNQNLWVCELPNAPANYDVHTTFNQNTALHLTVRQLAPGPCAGGNAGRTDLTGTWPPLRPASPNTLCGVVNPMQVAAAINQIPNVYAAGPGFQHAATLNRLTPAQLTGWMNKVRQYRC